MIMKKILLCIGIALTAIGCAKDETISNTTSDGVVSLFAGDITRVASDNDCAWGSDDEVGIYTDQTGEDNLLFTISDTATGALANKSETLLYTLPSGERSYYAYHPYDSTLGKATTIEIDRTSDQSEPLLWATATTNNTSVALQFAHKYAKVQFSLTAGGVDVTSLDSATAWLTGANAKATFDIESGGFAFDDESTADIALSIKSDNTITAYLPPMEAVAGNVKLWINAQGNTFVKSITTEAWESSSSYEYDITVGEQVDITSDGDDYFIYTATGLFEFASLVNGGSTSINGTLMKNIDLSTVCYEGGDNWTPIGAYNFTSSADSAPYTGTFDGGGCLVSGLYINTDSNCQGLFGYVYGGTIKNIGVDGSVTGSSYVGGVVGWSHYSSSITSCYNTGDVTATGSEAWVGGVVGISESFSSVTSCYNTGDITATGSYAKVGGVVGSSASTSSSISSCYNIGDVTATDNGAYVGGVMGYSSEYSSITSCYSCGSVSSASDTNLGGVVGYNESGTVSYCYYDTTTVDNGDGDSSTYTPVGAMEGSDDGTNYCGLTTANMQGDAATDGTLLYYLITVGGGTAWAADTGGINSGYPILSWQVVND